MLDAIKSANIVNNILILIDLFYLEGVVAHGRASSSLAFGTSNKKGPQSLSIAGLFYSGRGLVGEAVNRCWTEGRGGFAVAKVAAALSRPNM